MADLALTLAMAVWGSTFAVLRFFISGNGDPAQAASPIAMLALRMVFASSLLGLFMLGRRFLGPKQAPLSGPALRALLRDGFFCGALLGVGFVLQTEGLQRTTASRSGFLTGLLVIFVPILEFLFYKKRPAKPALLALLLAFAGMTILSGPLGRGGTTVGDLLTVGCAAVFAGHILALARAAPRHPLLGLLFCQLISVGLIAAIAGPLIEPTHVPRDPRLAIAIVYLALFATLFCFAVQTWAQSRIAPVRIALLSALEPVFAAIFAALLIGERLQRRELLGGALIVFGVLVGEVGSALLARRTPAPPIAESP